MEENRMYNIKNLIYEIRDKQVILDSDAAMLYGYQTKRINEAVKNNKNRFPERYCFRLTSKEYDEISNLAFRSKISTALNRKRNDRYLPYVFTQEGIAMLSAVLKSEVAVRVSINIIDAFIEMRKFIKENKNIFERIIVIENEVTNKFIEYDKNFDKIFNEMQKEEMKEKIFYEGQIYDAYSLLIDIIRRAKKEIVIIDNYVDKSMLDILTKKKEEVEVLIIGSNRLKLKKIDIEKFNEQYPRIRIEINDKYHDNL